MRVAMFFKNLRIAPATGAIKLGDERLAFFNADLVHTVFVAIEREHSAVNEIARTFDGIEDDIGREPVVRCCVLRHAALYPPLRRARKRNS